MIVIPKGKAGIFAGVELEGRFAGRLTLFVTGTPPREEITKAMQRLTLDHKEWPNRPWFKNVYLGAAGHFDYPRDTNELKWYSDTFTNVTIEHPVPDFFVLNTFKNVTWMVPLIWQGKPLEGQRYTLEDLSAIQFQHARELSNAKTDEERMALINHPVNRLDVKFDLAGGYVLAYSLTAPVRRINSPPTFAKYSDYSDDELLWIEP